MNGNKRGLTPVVAIILMVVVAVAAALAFYSWFKAFQSQTTATVSSASSATLASAGSIFQIVDVKYVDATQVNVSVYNAGSATITISQMNVEDMSATTPAWMACTLSGTTTVATTATTVIPCDDLTGGTPSGVATGDTVYIEARTADGVTASNALSASA